MTKNERNNFRLFVHAGQRTTAFGVMPLYAFGNDFATSFTAYKIGDVAQKQNSTVYLTRFVPPTPFQIHFLYLLFM